MTVITLFGATGKTGRRVLQRRIDAGDDVRILVRRPDALPPLGDGVSVIVGDVQDADAVDRTIAGADAVISVIGHVKGSPATLQTDGTRNIVEGMRRHGVTRLITLSGGGLSAPEDRPKLPDRVIRLLLKTLSGPVLADAEGHFAVLEESGLDWTVVRAPRLTEQPGRGYRVGWAGVNASTQVSRDDVADFVVAQLDSRDLLRRLPFVSW